MANSHTISPVSAMPRPAAASGLGSLGGRGPAGPAPGPAGGGAAGTPAPTVAVPAPEPVAATSGSTTPPLSRFERSSAGRRKAVHQQLGQPGGDLGRRIGRRVHHVADEQA